MACTGKALSASSFSVGHELGLEADDAEPAMVQGRVSRVVVGLLGDVSTRTHFHLVGNGQFVADMQAGLLAGGIVEARITTEKYFNGKATADEDVVAYIAAAVEKACGVTAEAVVD